MKDKLLEKIFGLLYKRFGVQKWWPAETKDEIVIGTILTQNTSWKNVEKAIMNLKTNGLCSLSELNKVPKEKVSECIKPAGFFNQKSQYLKNIALFFLKTDGFYQLSMLDTNTLREKLLAIQGVGKETADSILLYAFERPVFVIDAYTKRMLKRHNICSSNNYETIQSFFMKHLKHDVSMFNEYHALIVKVAKECCLKKPHCNLCPLENL